MFKLVLITVLMLFETTVLLAQPSARETNDIVPRLSNVSFKDSGQVGMLLKYADEYFQKNQGTKRDLDSAYKYSRLAEQISFQSGYEKGLGNSYAELSKILHKQNDPASGRYYADKAIAIFLQGQYWEELGYAYFDRSGYYSLYGTDMTQRVHYVELSLEAFRKSGIKKKEADVLKELGDLQQLQGNDLSALTDLRMALKIYQSINYKNLQGTYDLMGAISANLGAFEQGLKYGLLALQTAEEVGDTSLQLATICNRIGRTYEQIKRYDKAYFFWQKSLMIAQKYNDNAAIIQLTSNISSLLVEMNRPVESLASLLKFKGRPLNDMFLKTLVASRFVATYKELKEYSKATRYIEELLKLSKQLEFNDPNQLMIYQALIPFYLATSQFSQAKQLLEENEVYCTSRPAPLALSKNYLLWFQLDSLQGNYQEAIIHYQRHKAIGDSLMNEATNNQLAQLQIQFDTDKKNQDIILKEQNIQLLTKRSQLQNTELRQERFIKNFTLVILALLLIIVGLMIYHSYHKKRNQVALEYQQQQIQHKNISLQRLVKEKDWLVKEIHHRVKNNFHIVIGLLGTQSGYLKSSEAIDAISDSQHRIHAMSLIHQKLYQSENLSAINMREYIHELVDYLRDSLSINIPLRFDLQIERIELGLTHCIPIGLILNEAITNAVKYAFVNSTEGFITVTFKREAENYLRLTIADNGMGFLSAPDPNMKTMGMNLMRGLSEDIDGIFEISNKGGANITVIFRYEVDSSLLPNQEDKILIAEL